MTIILSLLVTGSEYAYELITDHRRGGIDYYWLRIGIVACPTNENICCGDKTAASINAATTGKLQLYLFSLFRS